MAMALTTRSIYVLRCDDPTCDSMHPQGNGTVFDDKEYLLQDAENAGWQVHGYCDRYGQSIHFCPMHIHAKCSRCGARGFGGYDSLIDDGWSSPNDDEAVCDDCHRELDERYR